MVEYRELGPHEVIDRDKGDQYSSKAGTWIDTSYAVHDKHTPFMEAQLAGRSVVYRRPIGADTISKPSVSETPKQEDILEEALRITGGDRQNQYGPPDQDFRRVAGMMNALFADKLKEGQLFEPYNIAQMMILMKMSRQLHQRKRDNWVDTAGYARCGQLCDECDAKKGQDNAK